MKLSAECTNELLAKLLDVNITQSTSWRIYIGYTCTAELTTRLPSSATKEDSRRLQAFHMTCQRRSLGIRWNDFIPNRAVADTMNLPSILCSIAARRHSIFGHIRRQSDSTPAHKALSWMPDLETLHITTGIAQLADHGPHGLARSRGTPDSLLLTHGLLLPTTTQHGGCYDPQPVKSSSEWVSQCYKAVKLQNVHILLVYSQHTDNCMFWGHLL